MNRWCRRCKWDDARRMDRGKVMTAERLEAGENFGRYLDVDGDGIPYRTLPGTHPKRGAFFTRGTTKDRYAKYSEEGPVYVDNMDRLLKKFNTAKSLVPAPELREGAEPAKAGVIYFGSTAPAMDEALDKFAEEGVQLDALRLKGFPVRRQRLRVHRAPRPDFRRRAEPRRAVALPHRQRRQYRSRRA